jgi:hypothetical protein
VLASSLAELQQEAPEEKRDYHHDYDVHSGTPERAFTYVCVSLGYVNRLPVRGIDGISGISDLRWAFLI